MKDPACFSDCGLLVQTRPDCPNGKPIRLRNGAYCVWLTIDEAWRLAGALTDAVIEVRRPLAGIAGRGSE